MERKGGGVQEKGGGIQAEKGKRDEESDLQAGFGRGEETVPKKGAARQWGQKKTGKQNHTGSLSSNMAVPSTKKRIDLQVKLTQQGNEKNVKRKGL